LESPIWFNGVKGTGEVFHPGAESPSTDNRTFGSVAAALCRRDASGRAGASTERGGYII
jgi:hypothetical protein